jgi:hypothetical protein
MLLLLTAKIIAEVDALRNTDCRLLQSKTTSVFAEAKRFLFFMKLDDCEITFREVGEGTNESIDLDKFDQYYHHLSYGTMINCRSISNGIRLRNHPKHGIEGSI